jgi:putative membrane protein
VVLLILKQLFSKSFEDYLKLGSLMGLSILMLKLILDGTIVYYINPKLIPLVVLSSVWLMITVILMYTKTRTKTKTKKISQSIFSYLMFIMVLTMGYFVSPSIISMASFQILSGYNQSLSSYNDNSANGDTITNNLFKNNNIKQPKRPRKVILKERNFVRMLDSLYIWSDVYNDVDIEIMGKVYRDDSMKSNEFAVVRAMMSCCALDTTLVGLLSINQTEIKVNEDAWVKIEGKVRIIESESGKTPSIEVQTVMPVNKPKNEFVYPY